MASLNKVFLIGNLTRDPELRYTPGGAALCALGMAVNRKYVNAKGEEHSDTCFVDIEVWGKQAESCHQYLRKGSPAFVEGRLRFDQWDDRETGRKKSKLLVTGERVQFLSGGGRSEDINDTPQEYASNSADPSDTGEVQSYGGKSGGNNTRGSSRATGTVPPREAPPFPIAGSDSSRETFTTPESINPDQAIDDIPF